MSSDDPTTKNEAVDHVRDRYAAAASRIASGEILIDPCATPVFGSGLYDSSEPLEAIPAGAAQASLGCGNPLAVADLNAGETVLDLGCGGGIDVLLSARRVGPTGRALGLDMTDEMLDLARRHATEAGLENVQFLKGRIEEIPLPDASVDVVISNCVITLSTDKPRVFREIARVLKPGGRLGISDLIAHSDATRTLDVDPTGCGTAAVPTDEYEAQLTAARLTSITITPTHQAGPGLTAAIVRAHRPAET
ncbi:methyltransferase domain-containing protein [Yinghuangia sp. ASG 101]|uniref:methyltransferase domain-containing protein n=1 Tax=Yinghuangia sp. ASG 101 TaxID=2896848 RepID=UPI001E54037E|nr:methyltransferase domain-containing protein [Yinghuangia sp. ASG 101]UGQ10458.1 methyltransferase domain-containing protein [Yinghuangia sp. ASG 101]